MDEEEQKPPLLSMGSDAEEEAERQVCVRKRRFLPFVAEKKTAQRRNEHGKKKNDLYA